MRRKSSGDPLGNAGNSPKLANQNRSLAKSYTALHSPVFENEVSQLRGAKSTEDLNDAVTGDSNHLPGVGRPYNYEDGDNSPRGRRPTTPGLNGRRTPGRSSPGSEMLTLDQFLKEANKSSKNADDAKNEESQQVNRRKSHDSESRSSENSNNSSSRLQQQNQHMTSSSSFMLSPASVRDLSASRNSRLSAGSGNDNSSMGSTGALAGGGEIFITSTPKSDQELSSVIMREHPSSYDSGISPLSRSSTTGGLGGDHTGEGPNNNRYLSHKRLSGEDWRSSSQESSPYTSSIRVNALASNNQQHPSSSSPRASGSHSSSNNSLNQQQPFQSPSQAFNNHQSPASASSSSSNHTHLNSNNNNTNQMPPPIPSEPPPPITATERLDRLTMLASSNPMGGSHQHYDQPIASVRNNIDRYNTISGNNPPSHQHHSSGNVASNSTVDHPHSRGPPDADRRRSQGSIERMKGMPNQFQPPIPRSQPIKQNSLDSSVVSGHNPSRPPSAHAAPFSQNNPPQQRPRPASVMGPSKHIRGVISRPPGGERRQQPQGQGGGNNNDVVMRRNVNSQDMSQTNNIADRPKSVPPHLFNKMDESGRREIPVPPPRRTRDEMGNNLQNREEPDGREPSVEAVPPVRGPTPVTLIREPSRRGSRPTDPSQVSTRPPSSSSSSHPPSHQPPQPQNHQGNNSNNNPSLVNSRQSSTGSLSSSQGQSYPTQRQQIRPDSLPLRGSHNGPLPQGHHNDGGNSYRPTSMPRSQSSIGNPISNQPQHPQSRSTTPGPHPARRNFAGAQSQSLDYRDGPTSEKPQSGQDFNHSHHNNKDPYSSSQGYDPRPRGGSEPRDLISSMSHPPTSSSGHHPQSHNASNHPSDNVYSSHNQHHPPPPHLSNTPRSHSQGPPSNRSHPSHHPQQQQQPHHHQPHQSGYSSSSGSSTNGPLSPGSLYSTSQPKTAPSYHHTHNNTGGGHNTNPPPPHTTAPQIRSQGKQPPPHSSNYLPESTHPPHSNNATNSNRLSSTNAVSVLRSPGEVMGHDRGAMGLPSSALPDAGSHPNQTKQPQSGDGDGGAPPAKGANSIWRPRWS